jgi:hypothetical protein
MSDYGSCRIGSHVALLDYVGGHFELEQSDMIFTPFLRPVLWSGNEKKMMESLLPPASSLAPFVEQPLGSYIRRQIGDEKHSR